MSNALNKSKSGMPAGSPADIFAEILSGLSAVYVLLMAGVFPLFCTDMYYNVLKDKYYFFFYSTICLAAVCLIVLLTGILGGALRRQKDGTCPLKKLFRPARTDLFLLAFLLITAVSTIASEWTYEAFWGTNGRLQGLAFYLVVGLGWIMVTKFYRFREWHLCVFLAVGLLVCLWGITDFLGLDLFGWRADADDYYGMMAYSSSIGNIDTFTALAGLYAGVFAGLTFRKKTSGFYMAGFFITVLAMITGLADNAVLALGGLFALLPFYVFGDRGRIGKFLYLAALFSGAMALTGYAVPLWTVAKIPHPTYFGALLKAALAVPKLFALLAAGFAAAGAVLQLTAAKDTRYRAKPLRILWGAVCLFGLSLLIFVIADVNTAGSLPLPEPVTGYLKFDDSWGSGRGYAWTRCVELFRESGFFSMLFGSGPETYGIAMSRRYYYEMVSTRNILYDSPHSEPLQYLFTTGILGFLAFYATMGSGIAEGLRKGGIPAAFALGCIPYLSASLINISTPVSTPLLFLALALAVSVKEYEKQI